MNSHHHGISWGRTVLAGFLLLGLRCNAEPAVGLSGAMIQRLVSQDHGNYSDSFDEIDDFNDIDLEEVDGLHHAPLTPGQKILMWVANKLIVIYLRLDDMWENTKESVRAWR